MLTLTRRIGESIMIGADIELTVASVGRGRVRLSIRAPREIAVHRSELVERVSQENQRALAAVVEQGIAEGREISFPDGLPGLREHRSFLLCDQSPDDPIKRLVSCRDPNVQLCVVDADVTEFPSDLARRHAGLDEETAVALVVTVHSDARPTTVNMSAPLVIGLESRIGRQILLERPDLPVMAALVAPAREAVG